MPLAIVKRKYPKSKTYVRGGPTSIASGPRTAYFKRKRIQRARSAFGRRVRREVLRMAESKDVAHSFGKTELYHNTGSAGICLFNQINGTAQMPVQGMQDYQRVGDGIWVKGFSVKMLLGQKADRPNVTFRIHVLSCPTANYSNVYNNVLANVTGNCLLDSIQTDRWKILYSKTIKKNWGPLAPSDGSKELTFPIKFWIPDGRKYTFTTDNGTTHDQNGIYIFCAAYDAYGSLLTDNIAYMQVWSKMYYKDP